MANFKNGFFDSDLSNIQILDREFHQQTQATLQKINDLESHLNRGLSDISGEASKQVTGLSENFADMSDKVTKLSDSFTGKVTELSDKVTGALDAAGTASDIAKAASKTAGTALDTAGAASDIAEAASKTAGTALDTAGTASDIAEAASKTAETASNTAGAALGQVKELSATVAETLGDSDKTMAICVVASAIAVTAITCLVAFFIYEGIKQGVKHEKEVEKDSFNDKNMPDRSLNRPSVEGIVPETQQGVPQNRN